MNWKLIWRGLQKPELRKKILIVFGILLVYRVLSHIPIPLAEPVILKQIIDNLLNTEAVPQLLSVINLLSGGALASLSIMLVGLGPYITASIVMQVLTRAIPKLETLQKEGEFGRKKINQYTRILTLPLAIAQSIAMVFAVRQLVTQLGGFSGQDILANLTVGDWALIITAFTTGAMILMWLGELITERGLGNGISLLITVAIVSQLPFMVSNIYNSVVDPSASFSVFGWFSLPISGAGLLVLLIIVLSILRLTIFVVYLNEAHRKIKLSYAKKIEGNRVYGDVSTFLPIKLIAAGVIPIIFALAFLTLPQLIGQLLVGAESPFWADLGQNLLAWFSLPGTQTGGLIDLSSWQTYIYPASYFLLVVMFTYFYTSIVFSSKDIAERLQRQGAFIENVRPGQATQKYLSAVVNRLNFFGSFSLGFLALTPILAQIFLGDSQFILAGTSILILVAVSLETLRQLESQALVVTYEDYEEDFQGEPKRGAKGWLRRRKR